MNIALLVLDERAGTEDIVSAYNEVNRRMREKYREQGITVLSNASAILGKEADLSSRSSLRFLPNWQTNPLYQSVLDQAVNGSNLFIMDRADNSWICREAKREDYRVRSLGGDKGIDVLPY